MNKIKSISLWLCFLICLSSVSVFSDDDTYQLKYDPKEIHKMLAQGKADRLKSLRDRESKALIDPSQTNQHEYDMTFYDIDIRVNDTTQYIYGAVKFVGKATVDNVSTVTVDFYDYFLMFIDSITNPSAGVLNYVKDEDYTTITLPQTINTGEEFEFTFYYHGHPLSVDGSFEWREYRFKPVIYTMSEPYTARNFWPCKDRPDDKADSFYIAITVDTSFYVATAGILDSIIPYEDNAHTFYYTERYPMATYLFALAISPYEIWYDEWVYNGGSDTMPIVNAVFPIDVSVSQSMLDITPYALDVLSEGYGLYPFIEEKYGHAAWLCPCAMEHQTMTFTTPQYNYWGFSEPVVVHELGHQWWGDYITCENFHHIWVNEGFASYSEALYYQMKDGWTAYQAYMNGMAFYGAGSVYVEDTTNVNRIFNSNLSYDKGAWVVHMLRGVLGDSLFFAGLDSIYNSELAYSSATTEDIRDKFELASGMDLDWYFEEWVYGEAYPNYVYYVWQEVSDTSGYDIFIKLIQNQTTLPRVFHNPIMFTFIDGNSNIDTVIVPVESGEEIYRLNFPVNIPYIRFDQYDWILKDDTKVTWNIHIITLPDDLPSGKKNEYYDNPIEYRSINPVVRAEIVIGKLPPGLSVDLDGNITGIPAVEGSYEFHLRYVTNTGQKSSTYKYTINIAPPDIEYVSGDITLDLSFDIGDILFLVEFMFNSGLPPQLNYLADVDGSCEVDIADLVYMVDFQFNNGPVPLDGCAF